MKSARSIRRAQERAQKKQAKKITATIDKAVSAMPAACDECNAPFDRTNHAIIDKWRIAVYDDGPIHLVCPDCVPADIAAKQ
jgi:hypothetical protein